jgi:uncharacterized protein
MSKFHPLSEYRQGIKSGYKLLPLRFSPLDQSRYVLTNFVGEHHVLQRDEVYKLIQHKLSHEEPAYNDLKSKHFLVDSDSNVAIDLLALKTYTKYERISNFTSLHLFVVTLRCEHSCPYCQVSRQNDDKRDFDMTPAIADKSLDLAFRSPSPSIKIEFQGGGADAQLPNYRIYRQRRTS